MIDKKDRVYVDHWFKQDIKNLNGNKIYFQMPFFFTGEYYAEIYIDEDGDAYIDKSKNYYDLCDDYKLIETKEKKKSKIKKLIDRGRKNLGLLNKHD